MVVGNDNRKGIKIRGDGIFAIALICFDNACIYQLKSIIFLPVKFVWKTGASLFLSLSRC